MMKNANLMTNILLILIQNVVNVISHQSLEMYIIAYFVKIYKFVIDVMMISAIQNMIGLFQNIGVMENELLHQKEIVHT